MGSWGYCTDPSVLSLVWWWDHSTRLDFEAKLWLDFLCAQLMSSKNDQRLTNESTILIAYLMNGIHINYCEVVAVQMKWKAQKSSLSMSFPILIRKLCAQAGIYYFPSVVSSLTVRIIDLDRKKWCWSS